MELKYFNINDNKESLKKKWKKLALQWHPDRNKGNEIEATKKMQQINSELEYCIKFGGEFDIGKYDVKNPNDLSELIKMLLFDMMDEMVKNEKNQSILKFYALAKEVISNGVQPPPMIRVIKDDEEPNQTK